MLSSISEDNTSVEVIVINSDDTESTQVDNSPHNSDTMSSASNIRQRKPLKDKTSDACDDDDDSSPEPPLNETTVSDQPPPSTAVPAGPKPWSSFAVRFIATWSMFGVFLIILRIGHVALVCLLGSIQILMFHEIVKLGAKPRMEKQLPGFALLHWLTFVGYSFFMFGQVLYEHILSSILAEENPLTSIFYDIFISHHSFVSFSLICAALVLFVVSLKAGFYRYQFQQLAWCIVTSIIVVSPATLAIANVMDGLVWFVMPSMFICTNDVWAYMFGRFFGKTPLIKLSPKKTWEGAIGGAFATFVFTPIWWYLASYFMDYQFFVCPKNGFRLEYPTCEPSYVFIDRTYDMPQSMANPLRSIGVSDYLLNGWQIAPFQFHLFMFSIFASVISPFGGFFASGFKRAFKIKDFGDSIPGHGGISDRMDCQIVMCAFVYAYRKAFIKVFIPMGVDVLFKHAMKLPMDQQRALTDLLLGALPAAQ